MAPPCLHKYFEETFGKEPTETRGYLCFINFWEDVAINTSEKQMDMSHEQTAGNMTEMETSPGSQPFPQGLWNVAHSASVV